VTSWLEWRDRLLCGPSPRDSQQATRVIGSVSSVSPGPAERPVMAFRSCLQDEGFVSGQNLAIDYRWAEGYTERLPTLVIELLRQRVEVIVATGGGTAALAAKAATTTVPIVFSAATDPVNLGLVASLSIVACPHRVNIDVNSTYRGSAQEKGPKSLPGLRHFD